MKFVDLLVHKDGRFSMGIEEETGKHYLSIPVSNQLADYEEYYEITPSEFDAFRADITLAVALAEECRKRRRDHLLMQKPGADRGVAS